MELRFRDYDFETFEEFDAVVQAWHAVREQSEPIVMVAGKRYLMERLEHRRWDRSWDTFDDSRGTCLIVRLRLLRSPAASRLSDGTS
jgi:hypothetical protein